MSLHPDRDELMAWRDGEVGGDRAAEIAGHIAECVECRGFVDALGAVGARLAQWTVEPAPTSLKPASRPASTGGGPRHVVLWAAAAVLLIGVLATVRVDCAPAPTSTCERHTWRLSFMPRHDGPGLPAQASAMTPADAAAFEKFWRMKSRADGETQPASQTIPTVSVDVFLDWQCPACRQEYRAYAPVFAELARTEPRVVVVYRDFPLNVRCNAAVPVELHPAACEAAIAVRLARERHTDGAMIDWLLTNQETLTPSTVRTAAATIGDIQDFDAREGEMRALIAGDAALGQQLGVNSTPSCFIDGVLARGEGNRLLSAEELRLAIDIERRRLK